MKQKEESVTGEERQIWEQWAREQWERRRFEQQQGSPTLRRTSAVRNGRRDNQIKRHSQDGSPSTFDVKRELAQSRERELSYEAALVEKDQREAELQRKVEESKKREAYLENELANMWVLVAKLKKSHGVDTDVS